MIITLRLDELFEYTEAAGLCVAWPDSTVMYDRHSIAPLASNTLNA